MLSPKKTHVIDPIEATGRRQVTRLAQWPSSSWLEAEPCGHVRTFFAADEIHLEMPGISGNFGMPLL